MSGSVIQTIGRSLYQLAFEQSPILLNGGVAGSIPGGYLPLLTILQALSFAEGLLANGGDIEQFFATFKPLPGGTLSENIIGRYPFANQTVAGNAIVTQPLHVSLLMICPVNTPGGYLVKLATMTALKLTLDAHISLGGTFLVATPSYIYQNGILLNLRDVTSGFSKQAQTEWQWDFEFPLITQSTAGNILNSLMSKISSGQPTDGALSGPAGVAGVTQSGAVSTIPAASSAQGSLLSSPLTGAPGSSVGTVTGSPLDNP